MTNIHRSRHSVVRNDLEISAFGMVFALILGISITINIHLNGWLPLAGSDLKIIWDAFIDFWFLLLGLIMTISEGLSLVFFLKALWTDIGPKF